MCSGGPRETGENEEEGEERQASRSLALAVTAGSSDAAATWMLAAEEHLQSFI